MKYYYEHLTDDNKPEWVREEISKETAILLLDHCYNHPCKIINVPCYYRLPWGGVEVVAE